MRTLLLLALLSVVALASSSARPVAASDCGIVPIKPIVPIGCKDLAPLCVSDGNGRTHWEWVCVK